MERQSYGTSSLVTFDKEESRMSRKKSIVRVGILKPPSTIENKLTTASSAERIKSAESATDPAAAQKKKQVSAIMRKLGMNDQS